MYDDDAETIPCPNCKEDIYEESEQCPHCGQYISDGDGANWWPRWFIVLGAVLALAGSLLFIF